MALPTGAELAARARADAALLARGAAAAALAAVLALAPADPAEAARGGGRVGGSGFRAPSVQRAVPRAPAARYGGGGLGGFGYGPSVYVSPFFMPFGGFGMGGGGIGTLLLFGTAAAFLYSSVATKVEDREFEEAVDPATAVVTLKVGMLATARGLQVDLDTMGRTADTASAAGLRAVLEETVVAMLRNPDYWAYGAVKVDSARLSRAEDKFNRLCLEERLKLEEETLTNAAGRRAESARASATTGDLRQAPGEFIVVTIIAAASGDLITQMPKVIDSAKDVNRALRALGGVSKDSLQGVEVIWAPQSLKDTVTSQELLADHPELRRL